MLYHRDAETRVVDLTKSKVDEEKTDLKKYDYYFEDGGKVYYKLYKDLTKSPWHFGWCNKDPEFIKKWRYQLGFDFVFPGKDPYFPECAHLNEENLWEFGDTVMMKQPIEVYIERQIERKAQNERRLRSAKQTMRKVAIKTGRALEELDKAESGYRDDVMKDLGFE